MGKESKKEWIDSQMALVVKNLPADAGATEVKAGSPGGRSPGGGRGDLSSILAWRIPMDRVAWQVAVSGGHKESDTTKATNHSTA